MRLLGNKVRSAEKSKHNNPFLVSNRPIIDVQKINPGISMTLSALFYLLAAMSVVFSVLFSRRVSIQNQQLAAITAFVVILFIASLLLRTWLAAINLIKLSRSRQKVNLSNLIFKYSHPFVARFFAITIFSVMTAGVFSYLLLSATSSLKLSLQVATFILLSGLFLYFIIVKVTLSYYVIVYENLQAFSALKKGFLLSRKRNQEIFSTFIAQILQAGISLQGLTTVASGLDELYHIYSAEREIKKPHKVSRIIVVLALVLLLLGAWLTRNAISANDRQKPAVQKQLTTDNFCYQSISSNTYLCSNNRIECENNEECSKTLDTRDEIEGLINSELN
ncbi:MAG: hypothetical protein M3Q79_03030 [bacterium]|nr:hypothetical protein [bacterium]